MSGNSSGPQPSFEQRLRAARERQGLDKPAGGAAPGGASGWGSGLQAGVELVSAELVAGAIGWGLDHWLHTLAAVPGHFRADRRRGRRAERIPPLSTGQ